MSTQKDKFALFARLGALGFTCDEAVALRRIEMTLQRWAEQECGDGNDLASFGIERDETTGKPFRVVWYHNRPEADRYPIADREAGALKRLKVIVDSRNSRNRLIEPDNYVTAYHQGDCRGCMLYLVRASDIPDGAKLESCYTNGLAVCA